MRSTLLARTNLARTMLARTLLARTLLAGIGALALACTAEPMAPDDDVGPRLITCRLGAVVDGAFVALPAPTTVAVATAELVLGFQGFVWIDLALQADEAPGDGVCKVAFAFELQGAAPVSSVLSTRFGEAGVASAGERVAPLRMLLSPADVGKLQGRDAALALRADINGLRCFADGAVALRNDDPCIHVDGRAGCGGGKAP